MKTKAGWARVRVAGIHVELTVVSHKPDRASADMPTNLAFTGSSVLAWVRGTPIDFCFAVGAGETSHTGA